MFIRRTETRARTQGESYLTYRLVTAVRQGAAVKQPHQQKLYAAWKLPPNPGGIQQTVVWVRHRGQVLCLDKTLPPPSRVSAVSKEQDLTPECDLSKEQDLTPECGNRSGSSNICVDTIRADVFASTLR